MTKIVFDPYADLRKLIALLYERGMLDQAFWLTRKLDQEQLCLWQKQACLSAQQLS